MVEEEDDIDAGSHLLFSNEADELPQEDLVEFEEPTTEEDAALESPDDETEPSTDGEESEPPETPEKDAD